MMRNTTQVFLLARTRSLVIAMCSQQEPRRGSVVVKTIDGSVEKYWGTETKT